MSLDKRATVQKILDDQNNLGIRADSKALAFLTTLGIFTAFFIAFVKDIHPDYFSITLLVIYFVAAILGVWNIIMAINPRIRVQGTGVDKNKQDPYRAAFFAEICKFPNVQGYKECLQDFLKDEETVVDVYSRQIYEVSIVTAAKYRNTQRAVYFVITALFAEFILIIYLFVNNAIAVGI
jgi:hypothetical protein